MFELLLETLNRDTEIDEYAIIYMECDEPFILSDHKLAINKKVHSKLIIECKERLKSIETVTDNKEKLFVLKACVMLFPENYTIWNIRKLLIQSNIALMIEELKVLNLIFFSFPKTQMSWSHRDWVYRQLLPLLPSQQIPKDHFTKLYFKHSNTIVFQMTNQINDKYYYKPTHITYNYEFNTMEYKQYETPNKTLTKESLFNQERKFLSRCCEIHKRCYYGWKYRLYLIQNAISYVEDELIENEKWIRMNISDYSAMYYRLKLFELYINNHFVKGEEEEYQYLCDRELIVIHELILRYPLHESLWKYLYEFISYIMYHFIEYGKSVIISEIMWLNTIQSDKFSVKHSQKLKEIKM